MPQIYWGFTNEVAPFDKMTDAWCILGELTSKNFALIDSSFIGWSSTEPGQSDEKELQKTSLSKKNFLSKKAENGS